MTQERLFSAILWLSIASYRYYNFQLDFSTWSPCEAFESFCQEYEPIHSEITITITTSEYASTLLESMKLKERETCLIFSI